MSKRIIAIVMSAMISVSFMGCGAKKDINNGESKEKTATERKYDELEGTWAKDLLLDELKDKYIELLKLVEEKTEGYGLEYSKDEIMKEENGETINDNHIYLDNENPEKNRLESLYFGMKTYGEDISSGQITMKLSLNFDGEAVLNNNDFDFGETSLASYSALFTGETNRDFSSINSQIIDILKSESQEGVISDSIDGLYEEFTVNKEYIVYKLETKKYDFKAAADARK